MSDLREALDALVKSDERAARRAIAQAQTMAFGLKPWQPGFPTHDVVGNQIVYQDDVSQDRYTVSEVQSNGAHVRTLMGGWRQSALPQIFEARAPDPLQAGILASVHATGRDLRAVREIHRDEVVDNLCPPGRRSCVIRYEHGRTLD